MKELFMTRVAVALLIAWSSSALAQTAGAQAEVLFRQGRDLMAAGKIAEACSAFAESEKLEPAVTTLINLAGCREKNNQFASAWGLFLDAERQTRSASDATTRQLHGVAHDHAQKLEPRLSTLTITVPEESRVGGLEILRNGDVVDVGTFSKALPVDGGTYTISARAPGNTEWSTTVTVAVERDSKTIEVPKLVAAALGAVPASPTLSQSVEGPSHAHASNVIPLVVGAGALALLGGALGFELWGESAYNSAKAEMMDQAHRDSLFGSANDKRYAAEGLAVAGVAAAGLAVWLFVRNRGDEPSTASASKSQLVVTPMGLAIVGGF
jgi:hypothetical protein